jgi:hypothetical protein
MTRKRSGRIIIALFVAVVLLIPAAVAYAQDCPDCAGTGAATPPPIAIMGPRLSPPAISHSDVLDPGVVYNNLLVAPGLPVQSLEADAADGGRAQEKTGRGIRQTTTDISNGIELFTPANVCNDFNAEGQWPSVAGQTDVWTDWFAGWAPFAVDNGYYQAKNVTFSRERVVGPGSNYVPSEESKDADQHSAKIASNQPYAAGFGSPIIKVPEGYEGGAVLVTVDYLIWDHDTGGGMGDGMDYDWASLGVKAGADCDCAVYVNGYVRGEWAEMSNVVELGSAKDIMVLIQGQSPGSFNSNIYYDNIRIAFIDADGNGSYLTDCKLAAE